MKLIVGLGNPKREHQKTRHNAGFMVIDEIAKGKNIEINKKKFNGVYNEFIYNDEKIILLKPQSYMNNSGDVIEKFINYFDIKIEDLLVIYDDYYIEVGKFKIKANGSSAGHNGLKSIENRIKTNEYKRIKIGISKDETMLLPDYVLSKFSKAEMLKINKVKAQIANIIDDYLKCSFEKFMSLYNKMD